MKIKITYEYDQQDPNIVFAVSEINGDKLFSSGMSVAQARAKHLKKLETIASRQQLPQPEEVEI